MALKPVDKKKNPGLAKLPKEVRNKMGFMKNGGLAAATKKLRAQGMKNGGSAKKFPDLSGDGKVTMKDVLMGRGVIKKKAGGIVRGTARGMGAATKGGGYNVEPN